MLASEIQCFASQLTVGAEITPSSRGTLPSNEIKTTASAPVSAALASRQSGKRGSFRVHPQVCNSVQPYCGRPVPHSHLLLFRLQDKPSSELIEILEKATRKSFYGDIKAKYVGKLDTYKPTVAPRLIPLIL